MARPKSDESTEKPQKAQPALRPFSVFVDGQDRTVMASDLKDAERQAEKLRSISSQPLKDGK